MNTCRLAAKFVRLFAGAEIIIVPDRDRAGEDGSQFSARVLRGAAKSVRIAVLPAEFKESDGEDVRGVLLDIADRIMERLPLFLLYIIGVTFIVLAMAFRSIVISLTAAITTILSAFVGFGVLTLIIQEGYLLGFTGLDRTGPIETFVPPIAFAILFGLSMDYMVFLMSRIREEHVHGAFLQARQGLRRVRRGPDLEPDRVEQLRKVLPNPLVIVDDQDPTLADPFRLVQDYHRLVRDDAFPGINSAQLNGVDKGSPPGPGPVLTMLIPRGTGAAVPPKSRGRPAKPSCQPP